MSLISLWDLLYRQFLIHLTVHSSIPRFLSCPEDVREKSCVCLKSLAGIEMDNIHHCPLIPRQLFPHSRQLGWSSMIYLCLLLLITFLPSVWTEMASRMRCSISFPGRNSLMKPIIAPAIRPMLYFYAIFNSISGRALESV